MWIYADSGTGYVLNHEVYLDKDNMDGVDLDAHGLGHYVVTLMTKPSHGKYHHEEEVLLFQKWSNHWVVLFLMSLISKMV